MPLKSKYMIMSPNDKETHVINCLNLVPSNIDILMMLTL